MKKPVSPRFRTLCSALALTAALGTVACSPTFGLMRTETAHRIAAPAFMMERDIPAGPFLLTAYERVRQPGGPVTVYIEGDGQAFVSRTEPSLDPTPTDPVALHLASRDDSPNVIYLARPCQYTNRPDRTACPVEYWTTKRFAPELVSAMNTALDDIKHRYQADGFNLVGYSGGGAMAVLLTGQRSDILTLRTVAGNLDPALFSAMHKVSPLDGSLNPIDVAPKTAHIPQHHFIGAWDDVVPVAIYDSYRRAVGPSQCVRSTIIDQTDHDAGWVNKWPELLKEPVDCNNPQ